MKPSQTLLVGALMLTISPLQGCEDEASLEVGVARRPVNRSASTLTTGKNASGTVATSSIAGTSPFSAVTPPPLPAVVGITISRPTLTLAIVPHFDARGDLVGTPRSAQLTAVVHYDDQSSNGLVQWSSGDPAIASVSDSGWVQGLRPMGEPSPATVSIEAVSLLDPRISATCLVTLVP